MGGINPSTEPFGGAGGANDASLSVLDLTSGTPLAGLGEFMCSATGGGSPGPARAGGFWSEAVLPLRRVVGAVVAVRLEGPPTLPEDGPETEDLGEPVLDFRGVDGCCC